MWSRTRALVRRIIRIACSPQAEWPRVAAERRAAAPAAHALVLAAVPALAAGTAGAAWRVYAASAAGLALAAGAFWVAGLWYARGARFGAACKLAVYGATTLWPAYALAALPALELAPMIAVVHALYLVDGGAHALLGVKRDDSVQFVVVAMALAGLGLWAIAAAAGAVGLL
jgi:hypothetical protein